MPTIKLRLTDGGYLRFQVRAPARCGGHGWITVHMLAAYQKYGSVALVNGVQVRHLDGDPANAKPANIRIGTPSKNQMDKPAAVRQAMAKNAAAHLRALTTERLRSFWRDRRAGFSYRALVRKYGVAKSTVSYIVRGRTYRGEGG